MHSPPLLTPRDRGSTIPRRDLLEGAPALGRIGVVPPLEERLANLSLLERPVVRASRSVSPRLRWSLDARVPRGGLDGPDLDWYGALALEERARYAPAQRQLARRLADLSVAIPVWGVGDYEETLHSPMAPRMRVCAGR